MIIYTQIPERPQTTRKVYKFKFDLQPGSLTDQVAGHHGGVHGEHQP